MKSGFESWQARMKLYFVTGNKEKFREVKGILHEFDVEQIELDLPELQGEPEAVAREKVKLACEKVKKTKQKYA